MNFRKLKFLFIVLLFAVNTLFAQTYYSFKENGKYGFKDSVGKILVRAVYDDSLIYTNGVSVFRTDRIFIINEKGQILRSFNYPISELGAGYEYSNSLLACRDSVTKMFGYLDTNANWKIPPKFYEVSDFKYGLATVWEDPDIRPDKGGFCGTPVKHMKWGVIKTDGSYLVRPLYLMPAKIDKEKITFQHGDGKEYVYDHNGWRLK